MSVVRLTLPLPPSVNNAYANRRGGGGRILSREGREYKKTAALAAIMQGAIRHHGDVSVTATVYFEDRRRDLDNILKIFLDALKGICYADDKQVSHLELHRRIDRGNPRIEADVCAANPDLR